MGATMFDSSFLSALGAASGGLMALVWVGTLVQFFRVSRKIPVLSSKSHEGPPADLPRISAIVAAKDEEANIESCVRSILSQDYARLDLVVVNDRSADRTLPILEGLRREFDGRMSVLTIQNLPEGWGGQNHALRQGVLESSGDWLWFTDADCRFESKRSLSIALREADAHGADLLSILPRMEAPTLWEKIYLPLCCLVFMMRLRIGEVNQPERPAAYANGAFMLVRRTVYEALGGHERVRNQLNDDICLAQIAKQEGFRLRVASNSDLYRTRMYGSVQKAWNGWTRNFYGTLQSARNLGSAFAVTLGLFVVPWLFFLLAAGIGWFHLGWKAAAIAWGCAVVASHLGMALVYAGFGASVLGSLLYFPAALFVAAVVGRAFLRARRRIGTVWHGAHYGPPG
jgi:chlorobactene glucosyltransferase